MSKGAKLKGYTIAEARKRDIILAEGDEILLGSKKEWSSKFMSNIEEFQNVTNFSSL